MNKNIVIKSYSHQLIIFFIQSVVIAL